MRVLVTGSSGFIGSNLVDALTEKGHYVVPFDEVEGYPTYDFKLLSDTVDSHKINFIYHLGANCSSQISLRDPASDFTKNTVGTFNVFEVSRQAGGIPVVFNSSMKVYPGVDGLISPYGISKKVGELYAGMYSNLYSVPSVINRPSSVYGPRQNASDDGGWFGWFIKASIRNETINIYGSGKQSRDVLYISDMVALLIDQMNNFNLYQGSTYNCGGGVENEVSLLWLLKYLKYDNINRLPALKGDVLRFVCSNEEVTAVNGWTPLVSWKRGLELTREYYVAQEA